MKVLVADILGMCFGVRDALKIIDGIEQPEAVTIHGELVHNEVVLGSLRERGFRMAQESDRGRVPTSPLVLITAHGVSDAERRRLGSAGKQLVDTTCPLVVRVHKAAQTLQEEGYHVLVIGRRGHVEVQGIIEDLDDYDLIQSADEVRHYPYRRLGIICQTTAPARRVQAIREAVRGHNPGADIKFIDTVCLPTKEHQWALERLAGQIDVMVVVGGRNSNNTRELVEFCREKHLPAYHVQGVGDLRAEWFREGDTVGLTAGTSTLDSTIEEVRQALIELKPGGHEV
jgi:4-hydroxy-3-methylbut-2-enyl diphosphate reductase